MRKAVSLLAAVAVTVLAGAVIAGPGPSPYVIHVEGVIDAVDADGQQIVVDGLVVQVTPATLIQMRSVVITFEDLTVGMTVNVCGRMVEDVLVAHQVTVKYLGK